jgi:hypothetical protein
MNEQDLMSLKKRLILLVSQCLCYVLHLSYRYRIIHSENRQQAEGMHPKQAFAIASWHQNCWDPLPRRTRLGAACQSFIRR